MPERFSVVYTIKALYKCSDLPFTFYPGQLSLAIPPYGRLSEYRPKGGDALQLGVKTDMVLFAGNTV